MLTELTIKNFAIIDRVQIEFGPGLNALTGETGAGKSILVDAIGLILGGKASPEMIRTGAEEASLEAFFDLSAGDAAETLRRFGLEKNEGLVIRRLVNRSGKSRAYLNGSAVTLGMLEAIAGELVDIYGQHEHQHFLEPKRHIDILDEAGDLLPRRLSYEALHRQWRQAAGELEEMAARQEKRRERLELLVFQSQEIARAGLREPRPGEPDEEETLTAERARLVHAEKLFEIAHQGFEALYGESGSALERLKSTRQRLREGEKIDPSLSPFRQALETAILQAEDAASSLRAYRDRVHFDPKRQEEVESRLDEIRKLKRKYGESLEKVIAYKKSLTRSEKTWKIWTKKSRRAKPGRTIFTDRRSNRPASSRSRGKRAPAPSKPRWRRSWRTSGWGSPGSRFAWRRRASAPKGPPPPLLAKAGWTSWSFSSPPTPGRNSNRWPKSPRAGNYPGSCSP